MKTRTSLTLTLLSLLLLTACNQGAPLPGGYAIFIASGKRTVVLAGEMLLVPGTSERLRIHGFVCSPMGKRFDCFAYPNRDHGLSEGNGTTVHVQRLITRYLIDHLPPGPR